MSAVDTYIAAIQMGAVLTVPYDTYGRRLALTLLDRDQGEAHCCVVAVHSSGAFCVGFRSCDMMSRHEKRQYGIQWRQKPVRRLKDAARRTIRTDVT
jgi:hypothetical protein